MYSLVIDNKIESVVTRLPKTAQDLETREWISPNNGEWAVEEYTRCGYQEIVSVTKPDDTDTHTFVKAVVIVNGQATEEWSARPFTQTELDAIVANANRETLSDLGALILKMQELKSFLTDVDIEDSLNRTNSVMPTASELNKTLKAMIRQQKRTANFNIRLAKYLFGQVHPELLQDLSDI